MKKSTMIVTGLVVTALGVGTYGYTSAHERGFGGWGPNHGYSQRHGMPPWMRNFGSTERDGDRMSPPWAGRHGSNGSNFGPGFGGPNMKVKFLCWTGKGKILGFALNRVESKLKPTEAQTEVWNSLKTSLSDAEAKVRTAICDGDDKVHDEDPSPVKRLARAETFLGTALDVVKTVRPSVDALYDTLSKEQKETLKHMRPHQGPFGWR